MTLLGLAGAEFEVTSGGNTPDGGVLSGTVTRDVAVFRSGLASFKFDSGAGNAVASKQFGGGNAASFLAPTASTTNYIRFYLNVTNRPGSTVNIFATTASPGAGNVLVKLTTTGTLQLWDGTTAQLGSDSAALTNGSWYRVEVSYVTDASKVPSTCELRLDGSTVATGSITGGTGVSVSLTLLGWLAAPGASSVLNIDDVATCDSTAGTFSTWIGASNVVPLFPISDNAVVTWTEGLGGTGSLFDAVNNTPPVGKALANATDVTQVKVSVANTTATYDANMTTYTNAGAGAGATVRGITIFASNGYTVTSGAILGLQVLSNPVISEVTATSGAVVAGIYPSGWFDVSKIVDAPTAPTLGTSPVLRIRHGTSSASRTQQCCMMGMYVDYTPAVATGRFPRNPAIDFADPAIV